MSLRLGEFRSQYRDRQFEIRDEGLKVCIWSAQEKPTRGVDMRNGAVDRPAFSFSFGDTQVQRCKIVNIAALDYQRSNFGEKRCGGIRSVTFRQNGEQI